jgi:hypothetical protein
VRINGQIKAGEVRVLLEDGSDAGTLSLAEALAWVASRKLDLVEIWPGSVPPICLAIDYGKYRAQLAEAEKSKPPEMEYDYKKRGYLLPEGCKDLIDVMQPPGQPMQNPKAPASPAPLPPIVGELMVPEQMTVAELAAVLKQKPLKIIADLMGMGVFANLNRMGGDFVSVKYAKSAVEKASSSRLWQPPVVFMTTALP